MRKSVPLVYPYDNYKSLLYRHSDQCANLYKSLEYLPLPEGQKEGSEIGS